MTNKNSIRSALITAMLLLVPVIAMQFSTEVKWDLFDFVVAGALIFGTVYAYGYATRKAGAFAYKAAVGLALMASLLLIWVNLAVGIIGSEDNPANTLYFAVIGIGFLGTIFAQLKPVGMARTLFAMAGAVVLVPFAALLIWKPPIDSPEDTVGVAAIVGISAFFGVLFAGSALLFKQSQKVPGKDISQ